jgi:hypothetical protein
MPSNLELHILKVQGVNTDLSIVGCYVSLDGRLYDVITPLGSPAPDSVVLLPSSGQLKLMIKKMSSGDDQVIGSVSFSLSLLPCVGGQFWLPLFESFQEDTVTSLAGESQGPRLLLRASMPRLLPPVHEMSENSIEDSSVDQQPARTPDESNVSRITFADAAEASKEETARPEDTQNALLSDMRQQLETVQMALSKEKAQREALETKLKTMLADYDAAQKRMIAREKTLTGHLLEKDKDLFKCIEENTELKIAARQTESELYQLQERVKLLEAQSSSVTSASEALEFALEELKESEQRRKELQTKVQHVAENSSDGPVFKSQLAALQTENHELRVKETRANREISQLREELNHCRKELEAFTRTEQQEKIEVETVDGLSSRTTPSRASSVIDRLLDEYFEERGQINPLVKLGEHTYSIDGRRLTLALKNATLMVKVGLGYVHLEDVLRSGRRTEVKSGQRTGSSGRATSAGRSHSPCKENVEGGRHKKMESEVPRIFSRERPVSPQVHVVSSGLLRPLKLSVTPLKERAGAKKPVSCEKTKKPFR